MMKRSSKTRDVNQIAFEVMRLSTGDISPPKVETGKNPAAVALGRLGGLRGGRARAISLSAKQRSSIAKKAAKSRWNKNKKD